MITPSTADIDNAAEAGLPAAYAAAKQALATCASIELCVGWMRRSEAIERAAEAAGDTVLYQLSLRLSARVMRRVGELLKMSGWSDPVLTPAQQHEVATRSGMSTYQQLVAVQLAELPEGKFERWLASNDPPTVNKIGVPLSPDTGWSDNDERPPSGRISRLDGARAEGSSAELRGHESEAARSPLPDPRFSAM